MKKTKKAEIAKTIMKRRNWTSYISKFQELPSSFSNQDSVVLT